VYVRITYAVNGRGLWGSLHEGTRLQHDVAEAAGPLSDYVRSPHQIDLTENETLTAIVSRDEIT